jgi:cytochrome c-type biogenesis protein CcmH
MTTFLIIAVLLTLAAGGLVLWPLLRKPESRAPLAAVAATLLLPAFVLFSYLGASNYDWARPPAPAPTAAAGAGSAPLDEAIVALEQRLKDQPADEAGWVLLGSSYTAVGRPDEAIAAYDEALRLSNGSNLDAKLGIAEAQLLKDRGALTGEAGAVVEAVLAAAPGNPKALWYGGLVALARGDEAAAEQRWTALLALSPPPRIREIVEAELAVLRNGGQPPFAAAAGGAAAGGPGGPGAAGAGGASGAAGGGPPTAAGAAVTVRVTAGDQAVASFRPGAPLFIFVRDAAGGPPLAVVRRTAAELPLTVTISDADVMLPGRSLGGVSKAAVTARVANGGDPVAKAGDVYGEAEWVPASGTEVAVVINRTVD